MYYVLIGIPKYSETFKHEYVYGDALKSAVLEFSRYDTEHTDIVILDVDSTDYEAISKAIAEHNGDSPSE